MYLGEVPLDKLVSAVFTISDAVVRRNSPVSRWMCCSMMEMLGKWVLGPTSRNSGTKVKVEPEVLKRRHP